MLQQHQPSKQELFRETRQFHNRREKIQRQIFRTLYEQVTEKKELSKEELDGYVKEWVHLTRRKLKQGRPASREFVLNCMIEFSKWLTEQQEKRQEALENSEEE